MGMDRSFHKTLLYPADGAMILDGMLLSKSGFGQAHLRGTLKVSERSIPICVHQRLAVLSVF
jgi:hypothetical protein